MSIKYNVYDQTLKVKYKTANGLWINQITAAIFVSYHAVHSAVLFQDTASKGCRTQTKGYYTSLSKLLPCTNSFIEIECSAVKIRLLFTYIKQPCPWYEVSDSVTTLCRHALIPVVGSSQCFVAVAATGSFYRLFTAVYFLFFLILALVEIHRDG